MSLMIQPLSLAPVLFRIASWPIGAVENLRSAAFSTQVDCALMREDRILARAEELSALLHAQVPRMQTGERRIALRVRRALHRSAEPAAASDIEALASHPAIGQSLVEDDAERRCLQKQFGCLNFEYAAALDAELEELRGIAGDMAFRRAVAVASLSTSDALEELLSNRTKAETWRLRATLLNYAMRAAGRATPNGLWSGVALESSHHGHGAISFRDTPRTVFVKPDLNAYFELFDLAASPQHYRRAVRLRWNPTTTELDNGDYACAHRNGGGAWVFSRTANDGHIARLREVFESSERAEFEELRARSGLEDGALDDLYLSGLLCPACDEGGVYEDAWSALDALVDCLSAAERPFWRTAICESRGICGVLAEAAPNSDVGQLRRGLSDARGVINTLRARYGAAPLPSGCSVLVFDQTAPFEIGISDDVRHQISCSLRRYWNFDRGGVGELLARNARMSLARNTDADIALILAGVPIERPGAAPAKPAAPEIQTTSGSWEETANSIDDPGLAERFQSLMEGWTTDLEGSWRKPIHHVAISNPCEGSPMPPGSALLVPAFTPRSLALRVGSVAPDWAAFYGRFHHLFAARGDLRFRDWLSQSKTIAEAEGVDLADVAIRGEHDHNAALRPRLGSRILDAFSERLTDLTAEFDAAQGVRLRDHEGRRVFPVLQSAVETSNADPWGRWFAEVEGNTGRTSLLAPAPPLARELGEWKHCPRLALDATTLDPTTLDPTTVIGPERWWCPRETTEQLRRTEGFDRYLVWRRWVRHAGVPARVYTRHGTTGTETLLLSDSVLAIEVLGRALLQTDSPLRLQEMFFGESGLWLEDRNGRKYLAEMAIAWRADGEFWRS
ncbi:MAG TPA: lantibiotic dehydratase [Bryobacteraceae bacterium]|nr:lantibiotic dehydratase [Bryobacteraceae bacterium]